MDSKNSFNLLGFLILSSLIARQAFCQAIPPCLDNVAVFTDSSMTINTGAAIQGDAYSNGPLTMYSQSELRGNITALSDVNLNTGAIVHGNAEAGGSIYLSSPSQVSGTVSPFSQVSRCHQPAVPPEAPGGQDVAVQYATSLNLSPGSYRDLTTNYMSTLTLTSGKYIFRNFHLNGQGTGNLKIDASNGPVDIHISGQLSFGYRTDFEFISPASPFMVRIFYSGSTAVEIGSETKGSGILFAPNAHINTSATEWRGAIYAKTVFLGYGTRLTLPPTLMDLSHSETAFAPVFNPNILNYTAVVSLNVGYITIFGDALSGNIVQVNDGDPGLPIPLTSNPQWVRIRVSGPSGETVYTLKVVRSASSAIHVRRGSSGGDNGTSWADAYNDLGAALVDAKLSGKEIWTAEGVYLPQGEGARARTFLLEPGIELLGGFQGDETSAQERKGDINSTVLSGDLNGDDGPNFPPSHENIDDNAYHVVKIESRKSAKGIHIDGFRIMHGNADDPAHPDDRNGAGIFNRRSSASITRCILERNRAIGDGGGLLNAADGAPTLRNCAFHENLSNRGGGVYNGPGTAPKILNTLFSGNRSVVGGGGANDASSAEFINSTFSGNVAHTSGGGLAFVSGSNSVIANSILWSNDCHDCSTNESGEISNSNSQLSIANSNVECGINGCKAEGGGILDLGGNINSNPLFRTSASAKGADELFGTDDDGLRIGPNSPSIDAGSSSFSPEEDFASVSRPQDGNGDGSEFPDMGAYEFFQDTQGSMAGILFVNDGGRFQPLQNDDILVTTSISTEEQITVTSKSLSALTLRPLVPNHSRLKDSFITHLYMVDPAGNKMGQGVNIRLYRIGSEGNKVIYQTQRISGTTREGKPIILSDNPSMEGEHSSAYVLFAQIGSRFQGVTSLKQF